LPAILEGRDVRVQAKTGSGKTAAFGLGLLQHIDAALFQTQSLVLCPTRELADQVAGELRRLARFLPNTKILTSAAGSRSARSVIRCSMRRTLLSPRRAACSITCKKAPSRWMRYKRW
jgi:superfamily II DNA/RNA helicase